MKKEDIDKLITKLKEDHSNIPVAVYQSLESHLGTKFGSTELTNGELSTFAKELLVASSPVAREGEQSDD